LQSYKSQWLHCQQSYEHQNCVSKIFAKKPFSIIYLSQKHKSSSMRFRILQIFFTFCEFFEFSWENTLSVEWNNLSTGKHFLVWGNKFRIFSEKNCYFAFHLNCQVQNRCLFVYWLLNLSQLSLQNNNIIENVGKPQTPLPLNAFWMWHK